jgi:UDP-glucose 4-epimerase
MAPSRVLVTGGAGFIGSHVVDRFLAMGAAVTVIDDLSNGKRERVNAMATFHPFDIRSPEAAALVRGGSFDVIVHLAAQMDVRKSVADPVDDASRNILGSLNLLEAIRTGSPKTRLVFSSTGGAVYGDFDPAPSRETIEKNPESPYGIAKLSVEYYLAYYARLHELDVVALRYANVYGPRQDPHGEAGVVAIFCERLLSGQAPRINGDGLQTRDYVFVGDVVEANICAAVNPLPDAARLDARAFNIGTGVPTSVVELAAALQRVAGTQFAPEFAPHRPGEQLRSFVDTSKARATLGWMPRKTLAEGLDETYRWFAAHRTA